MDRLAAMDLFRRVAEVGCFSTVAHRLGVAPSAVTRQIASLESHLGVRLFVRSTRHLNLTSDGAAYFERCLEILRLVEAAEDEAAQERLVARGNIRLSIPIDLGARHLMPLLSDFAAENPNVCLDIDLTDRLVSLTKEGFDLAIRIADQLEPTQVARKLTVCRAVLVASPSYLERWGTPECLHDLLNHRCLTYPSDFLASWPFEIHGQTEWVPVKGRLQANNCEVLLAAALRGEGIFYQPTFLAAPAVKAGLLIRLLSSHRPASRNLYALLPGNRHIPHRVRMLVDYLAGRIGLEPYWDADLIPP